MTHHPSRSFWIEAALSCLTGAVAVLTALWPAWIEGIFGFDPDRHNGLLEWIVVVSCAMVTILLLTLARVEWRKGSLGTSS